MKFLHSLLVQLVPSVLSPFTTQTMNLVIVSFIAICKRYFPPQSKNDNSEEISVSSESVYTLFKIE
jgi:hypothetical protein